MPTELLKHHQILLDGLEEEEGGKEFDDGYRLKMVASHKEAVSLLDESVRESEDSDFRKFAAEMLPKLQMHGGKASQTREAAKN